MTLSTAPGTTTTLTPGSTTEGVVFTRSGGDLSEPLFVNFSTGGTATPGTDYNQLSSVYCNRNTYRAKFRKGIKYTCGRAVDFTNHDASVANLPILADAGIHAVVGTTGLSEAEVDGFRAMFRSSNAVLAPNFAIGAVLMMRFAEMAAPYFDSAEIIELHH